MSAVIVREYFISFQSEVVDGAVNLRSNDDLVNRNLRMSRPTFSFEEKNGTATFTVPQADGLPDLVLALSPLDSFSIAAGVQAALKAAYSRGAADGWFECARKVREALR